MPSTFQRIKNVAKLALPRAVKQAWDSSDMTGSNSYRYPDMGAGIVEQDLTDRKTLLQEARRFFKTDPIARNAIMTTTNYVVGDRVEWSHPDERINQFLRDFTAFNNLKTILRPWVSEMGVHGELYLEHKANDGGMMKVKSQPANTIEAIELQDGDLTMPTKYGQKFETSLRGAQNKVDSINVDRVIEAKDMLHVKINHLSDEKFGRSDLSQAIPYLRMYDSWLKNRMRVNYNKTLFMVDASCTTGEALESAIARFDKKDLQPGMFNLHSSDETYTMVQPAVGAEDAMEDGRAVKLMIANALGLPEYMLADGQNSNLASSQSQELPVIKKFKDRQEVVERMLRDIFNLAFQHAMEKGLLPKTWKNDEGEFPTDASFISITLGMLEEENFKEKAEPLMKLQSLNLLSKQTVLTELGFDPEQEAKQIEIEAQEEPDL